MFIGVAFLVVNNVFLFFYIDKFDKTG